MPTSLPTLESVSPGLQRNAFNVVKGLEAKSNGGPQTLARLLGWLLVELPEDHGKEALAADILWCLIPEGEDRDDTNLFPVPVLAPDFDFFRFGGRDERLCEFGRSILDRLIGVFKREATPAPSTPSSMASYNEELQPSEQNCTAPELSYHMAREQALVRDGHGCALSKHLQDGTDDAIRTEIQQRFPDFGLGYETITEACHIIPTAFTSDINEAEVPSTVLKRKWASNASAILSRYTPIKLVETLKGSDVHRLENIITLSCDLHGLFDDLGFCLDHTDNEDVYRIWAPNARGYNGAMNGDLIALVDRSPPQLQGRYPLPSCDYLKLHAVCCHVAHLSGADSYLDELREEMQEVRTLAEDGSSTELLASALARVAVR